MASENCSWKNYLFKVDNYKLVREGELELFRRKLFYRSGYLIFELKVVTK